jgi:hypothetical protein
MNRTWRLNGKAEANPDVDNRGVSGGSVHAVAHILTGISGSALWREPRGLRRNPVAARLARRRRIRFAGCPRNRAHAFTRDRSTEEWAEVYLYPAYVLEVCACDPARYISAFVRIVA